MEEVGALLFFPRRLPTRMSRRIPSFIWLPGLIAAASHAAVVYLF
jgi:hypothetical protein